MVKTLKYCIFFSGTIRPLSLGLGMYGSIGDVDLTRFAQMMNLDLLYGNVKFDS